MHYRCDKPKVIFEHENIITSKGNMAFAIRASKHSCQLFHLCCVSLSNEMLLAVANYVFFQRGANTFARKTVDTTSATCDKE